MARQEKVPLGTLYSRINRTPIPRRDPFYRLKQYVLAPLYWALSHYWRTPGLFLHRAIIQRALKVRFSAARNTAGYHEMVTLPLDSVRYFEFDFMWRSVASLAVIGRYLDISSPRMFPLMVLQANPQLRAELVNPDLRDLETTRQIFDCCGVSERCTFRGNAAGDLDLKPESFDLITCISVLEHIPGCGDCEALEKIWQWLKPGGMLLLSVPCAANPFEEYIDYDEYRLLAVDADNFVFGQRFYNDDLLRERIFSVTGLPVRSQVYGEKRTGFSIENRQAKINDANYPFWREPYLMGQEFTTFPTIGDLPGWGVVALEFSKPG